VACFEEDPDLQAAKSVMAIHSHTKY